MRLKYLLPVAATFAAITIVYYAFRMKKQILSSSQVVRLLQLNDLEDKKFYDKNCFDQSFVSSLDKLEHNLKLWSSADNRKCQILWKKFHTMYHVEQRVGRLLINAPFSERVKSWLGNDEMLYSDILHQPIINIRNVFTREETVFNSVRSKRPSTPASESQSEYIEKMNIATKPNCDFCSYNTATAKDVFERVRGKFCVSVSNTFKLERYHGMILSKSHNPLDISLEEFLDLFNTSLKWFQKAHRLESTSSYPMSSFDTLPKGGASQFHPHVHTFLSPHYLDHMRSNLEAAQEYGKFTGGNMWQDFLEIHYALELAVIFGDAVAISPLTPQREYEVLLMSNRPGRDLFILFYYVIKTYYDELERPCFSAGMAYPYMVTVGETRKEDNSLPAIIRVGTRGKCNAEISDISSLDLYVVRNVHVDSYVIINKLKQTLKKYDTLEFQDEMINPYED